LVEVLVGQYLPLAGIVGVVSDMPLKAALKCLLHFFLEIDSALLGESDKSYCSIYCILDE
jgi:hypothetical protein